jgi:TolB-like protein/DNA-binding winged helix-turn-helix (wHTH) protein
MSTQGSSQDVFRFGVFEADLRTGELRKNGVKVRIADQPFRLLSALLVTPGQFVTREELRHQIWAEDTFVDFEHGLNSAIKRIRTALEDDAENPRFIATLPRRGYKFLAPVTMPIAEGASAPAIRRPQASSPNGRWLFASAAAIVAALGLLVASNSKFAHPSRNIRPAQINSIAVLPLDDLTHDPQHAYLADGMTDELINELGQVKALRVVSRTSVMQFRGTRKPLPEITKALNVDAVVEGSVLSLGGRVRITAQLIEAKSDRHLWAKSYERDSADVLRLQAELAGNIADAVNAVITPQEHARLSGARPVKPQAYDNYLKGLFAWRMASSEKGFNAALPFFEKAVREDPEYPRAYAALASIYATLDDRSLSPRASIGKAQAAAAKAIELDDQLAEAHVALAGVRDMQWNMTEALREYRRAIELNPSSALAHQWYGEDLIALRRFGEGIAEIRTAVGLDPLSTALQTDLAFRLYFARRFDESISQARHVLELVPNSRFAHQILGSDFEQLRRFDLAMQEWNQDLTLGSEHELATALNQAYRRSGYSGALRQWIKALKERSKHEYVSPLRIAELYSFLGDNDNAYYWLERGMQEHTGDLIGLNSYPMWDSIRTDPRFLVLLRRVGLPET